MTKIAVCVIVVVLAFGGCTTRDFYGMELVDNPKAQNVDSPTLLAFLERDKTDENGYELWEYDCKHFARDLHNNAEIAGIRCALVRIPERGHICNAFETTDRGLLFVDISTELDSIAYERDGLLVVDAKIKEGIGDSAILFLGNPEDFEIEW